MSRERRSQPICLGLLMFGLAIQAVTPDPNDLVSGTLWKLLTVPLESGCLPGPFAAFPDIADSDASDAGNGSLPSGANQEDGLPDEICLPAGRSPVSAILRGRNGSTPTVLMIREPFRVADHNHRRHIGSAYSRTIASPTASLLLAPMIC